jgi:formate dehydrogenase subunit delta
MSGGLAPTVRLANEIAIQFRHQPDEVASAAIAKHITTFWDPRMRAKLLEHVEADPTALDPLALSAARLIQAG